MNKNDVTILVVEDEPTLREEIVSSLQEEGYNVLEAADGYQALEQLRFKKIDVVTSDLRMPQLTGLQLLRAMRSTGFYQPFIVISGFGTRQEIVELLRLGSFDFIEKPFTNENLYSVVAQAASLTANQAAKTSELIKTLGVTEREMSPSQEEAIRQLARLKSQTAKKKD